MMFYKIIKNNLVVDVNNSFFCVLEKHHNIVQCKPEDAQLIQSSNGQTFYTTEWLRPLPSRVEYETVRAVVISEEEYLKLKEELKVQEVKIIEEVVTPQQEEVQQEEVHEEESIMTAAEMRNRILELETLIKQLLNK